MPRRMRAAATPSPPLLPGPHRGGSADEVRTAALQQSPHLLRHRLGGPLHQSQRGDPIFFYGLPVQFLHLGGASDLIHSLFSPFQCLRGQF